MADVINIGTNVMNVSKSEELRPYSRVIVTVDEETEYVAGNDSGETLELQCPWGTQEMADNILNKVMGYQYQPYTADTAIVEPSAEIGDAIYANDVYGGLYKQESTFGSTFYSNLSAPADEQLDHEFTYTSPTERRIARQTAWTKAQFSVTDKAISAEVKAREKQGDTFEAQFKAQGDLISARVTSSGGNSSSFGWNLTSTAFTLSSKSKEVFKCNKDGIVIDGKITAREGFIGNEDKGFTITSTAIYNGKPKFHDTTNENKEGVYIGVNGIALGTYSVTNNGTTTYDDMFRVGKTGTLVANNATIRGNLTVKKIQFESGVSLDGKNITSGTVGGDQISDGSVSEAKTSSNVKSALSNGNAAKSKIDNLIAGKITASGLNTYSLNVTSGAINVGQYQADWKSKTISGTTIYYLGRGY